MVRTFDIVSCCKADSLRLRKSTNEIRTRVSEMKQSAAVFPYLEQFETLAQTLLDRLKRGSRHFPPDGCDRWCLPEIETMHSESSHLLVRGPPVSTQPSPDTRESYPFQRPHGTTTPSPSDVSVSGSDPMSQVQPSLTLEDRGLESNPLKPHTKLRFWIITLTRTLCSIEAEPFALTNSESAQINTVQFLNTHLSAHEVLSVF